MKISGVLLIVGMQSRFCRLAVSEYTEITPATEIVVEGFATSTIDKNSTGLLEADAIFFYIRDCWRRKL